MCQEAAGASPLAGKRHTVPQPHISRQAGGQAGSQAQPLQLMPVNTHVSLSASPGRSLPCPILPTPLLHPVAVRTFY